MARSGTAAERGFITVRVSPRIIARADSLIDAMSEELGQEATRSDVFRRALAIGLRQLSRREHRAEAMNDD